MRAGDVDRAAANLCSRITCNHLREFNNLHNFITL